MENSNQITFEKFLYVLKKRIVWILLIALAGGLLAGIATKLLVTPEYVSSAKFYVNASDEQKPSNAQSDLSAAKSLVDTYIVILKSDTFIESVAESAEVDYTPARIRSNMNAGSISSTEVFSISISDPDPEVSYKICASIAAKAPDEIKRVVDCGTVTAFDPPKIAAEPNSIGAKRNAVIAAALFAVISFLAFFIVEISDVTIYTEDDLIAEFSYPIIGTIPSIIPPSASNSKKRKHKGSGYGYGGYDGYGEQTADQTADQTESDKSEGISGKNEEITGKSKKKSKKIDEKEGK